MESEYDIEQDPIFVDFKKQKKDKSKDTYIAYKDALTRLYEATGEPIHEIYKVMKEEQRDRIEDNIIIKFSPNDVGTHTKHYYNQFIQYLEDRGNRSTTIRHRVKILRSFFGKYQLELPDWEEREDDSKDWEPLSKEDIAFVINDSPLPHKAMITFMLCGMREGDVCRLTIRDFMEATKDYHNFTDAEEFIDNAPQDMEAYWDFDPHKTKRHSVRCMTFSTAESSNYILQNLRKIKNEYLPKKNKRSNTNVKITKDSALFGSRDYYYISHLNPKSITNNFNKKNKKLRNHHLLNIEQRIKEGKLSEDDREKAIKKIPVFHAHALRKYFSTTISRYGDARVCERMEGHAPTRKNDKSYIHIDKERVSEVFEDAKYDLSIFDYDEDRIAAKNTAELKEEIKNMKKEKRELEQQKDAEIAELKAELAKQTKDIADRLAVVENQLPHLGNTNPIIGMPLSEPLNIELMMMIRALIEYHQNNEENPQWLDVKIKDLKYREKRALIDIAYDLIIQEDEIPEALIDLDPLLIKALFKMEANPQLVDEVARFYNERSLNIQKVMKYSDLLYDLLAENYLTTEEKAAWEKHKKVEEELGGKLLTNELQESRLAKMAKEISLNFYDNLNDYLLEEITEDFVMEDIKEFFQIEANENER